jgi:hypothetical protein
LLSSAPLDISTEITRTARPAMKSAKKRAESDLRRKNLLSGIKSGQVNASRPRDDPTTIGTQENIEEIKLVLLT